MHGQHKTKHKIENNSFTMSANLETVSFYNMLPVVIYVRKVAELGSNTLNDLTSRSVHNLGTLTPTQTHSTFI